MRTKRHPKKSVEPGRLSSNSMIRRFGILYMAVSLIPFILLFFLFSQYGRGSHTVGVSQTNLGVLILLVGAACMIGFFALRAMIHKIVRLTETVRQSLDGNTDRAFIAEMMKGEGEVAELAKSFNIVLTDLEKNIDELERTRSTLYEVLSKVGNALASMEDFDSLIGLTLETTVGAIGVKAGAVLAVQDDGSYRLVSFVSDKPCDAGAVREATQRYVDWMKREPNLLVIPVMGNGPAGAGLFAPPAVCAPLMFRGKTHGILCLAGKRDVGQFTEDEVNLINNLATQIGVSFENLHLNEDRERTYFETIAALALAVEARDPYSRGHSERVSQWSVKIGRSMGLPETDVQTLGDAARLHDVGKIGISDMILLRQGGPLSREETEIMRQHPVIGENIVAPMKTFAHLRDPVRHHHERLDGSGYPDGLKGDQVSLLTRIIAVADMFDAMNEARPYRDALPPERVRAEFEEMVRKGQVDGTVVDHLFRVAGVGAAGEAGSPSPGVEARA